MSPRLLAVVFAGLTLGAPGCDGRGGECPVANGSCDGGELDGGPGDGGSSGCDPATKSQTRCCRGGCNNDVLADPVCVDGAWACAPGDASEAQCGSQLPFCTLPGPPSSLKPCVDDDAGVCLDACDPGEVCFTQVTCGPLPDGGGQCNPGPAGPGDGRCHALCGSQVRCGGAESCRSVQFFGCGDYNGARQICCGPGQDAGC